MVTFSLHFFQLHLAIAPGLQPNSAPAGAICKPPFDIAESKLSPIRRGKQTCFTGAKRIHDKFSTARRIVRDAFSYPISAVRPYSIHSERSENTSHAVIKLGILTIRLSAIALEDTNPECTSKVRLFSFGHLLLSPHFT